MDCSILNGRVIKKIKVRKDKSEIYFETANDEVFAFYHIQDCCESVTIDDISGDLQDLINEKIIYFSETINEGDSESSTWTFYDISTLNTHIQIKWYGESNGYYSESVDFTKIEKGESLYGRNDYEKDGLFDIYQ